jgi:uncharacterized membrane protein
MLSITLASPSNDHGVLLFGMVLCLLLLIIESRRYRHFDVYRRRVRLLERNYYSRIFQRENVPDERWVESMATDLRSPMFSMTTSEAISRRLRRNYIWIFLVLLIAWILKVFNISAVGHQWFSYELVSKAALGPVPGSFVAGAVTLFYCLVTVWTFRSIKREGELSYGEVHV